MNEVIKEQIEEILSDNNIPWGELKNSRVLITGANGLIGSLIVKVLEASNDVFNLNVDIISHTRKTHGDIREPLDITLSPDYIFHCAAVTKSTEMLKNPA